MKNYLLILLIHAFSFAAAGVPADSLSRKILRVGDNVPDITFHQIVNYPKKSAKLSDLGKNKLLILDFWTTWCVPCVKAFPKIDSLQKKFDKDVLFMPVTGEPKELIETYMQRLKTRKISDLPSAIDTAIYSYFLDTKYNLFAGQYVWIKDGKVMAYSVGSEALNERNIHAMLRTGILPDARVKFGKQFPLNFSDSSLLNRSGKVPPIKYSTVITGYLTDYETTVKGTAPADSISAVRIVNNSIFFLYLYAYYDLFEPTYQVLVETKNPEKFRSNVVARTSKKIDSSNLYCYEKVAPKSDYITFRKSVQNDLEKAFGYGVTRESRMVSCAVLKRTKDYKPVKDKSAKEVHEPNSFYIIARNVPLSTVLRDMEHYLLNNDLPYLINETGIDESTRINLEISGDVGNPSVVNDGLKAFGFELVIEKRSMPMTIVREKMTLPTNEQH